MRFRRIRLRDYRGVVSCDLELLPAGAHVGVTVVEGPNEVGKSSLAEALSLLWSYPHSSRHRDVRAVQPVGRDVGSTVSVEVDGGEVAFVYEKTFNREAGATLRIHRPRSEQRTGKEAHARVEELLASMVDRELWQALQVPQGHIAQPELADATGLTAALAAARGHGGQTVLDERDLRIAERVAAERDRWRTAAGRDRKRLREAEELVARLRRERDQVAAVLAAVADDAAAIARLRAGLPAQREAVTAASAELVELGSALGRGDELERRGRELRLGRERVEAELATATAAVEARRALVAEVAVATADVDRALGEVPDGALLSVAASRRATCEQELADAEQQRRDARAAAEEAQRRMDTLSDVQELDRLTALQRRVGDAAARMAAAEQERAAIRVTTETIEALRHADRAVALARAEVSTLAPDVVVEALADTRVEREGVATALRPGGRFSAVADQPLRLRIGDAAVVTVAAGDASQTAQQRLASALRERDRLLEDCGCADLPAAEEALASGEAALRRREAAAAERRALLASTEADDLEARIAACRARLDARGVSPPTAPEATADAPAAREVRDGRDRATARLGDADRAVEAAAQRLADACAHEAAARDAAEQARAGVDVARSLCDQVTRRLERARTEASDEQLAEAQHALEVARTDAGAAVRLLEAELADLDPASLRERVASLRVAVDAGTDRIAEDERRLAALESAVATRSDDGPRSRLDAVEAQLARAEQALAAARRRADAAALLDDLFTRHRAEQRERHLAPLAAEIRRLGRILWGPTFDVELDDDLRVAARVLDGTGLPFEQLSMGAQEQLALITRLACAIVVGPGGAPLIIDDALGFSDPERLRRMGAVLSVAGRSCQIVLLTCHPQRYLHVAGARTVQLSPPGEGRDGGERGRGEAA